MNTLIDGENGILKKHIIYSDNFELAKSVGNRLLEFAESNPCLGLAANQLGIDERVCICLIDNKFEVFINPDIDDRNGEQLSRQEGCLSWPGVRGDIKRPEEVQVKWIDFSGAVRCASFTDIEAIIVEHEIDHLNGIRCIDKMRNKTIDGIAVSDKVGRNDLCPCGSGEKYKKCCMK